MTFKTPTREDDERLLAILAMRRRLASSEIAEVYGIRQEGVRAMTNIVVKADIKAHPDADPAKISAEYGFLRQDQAIIRTKGKTRGNRKSATKARLRRLNYAGGPRYYGR